MAIKIACINNNKIARCLCFLEFDNFVNLLIVAMSKLKGDNTKVDNCCNWWKFGVMVFNTTFNNISVMSLRLV